MPVTFYSLCVQCCYLLKIFWEMLVFLWLYCLLRIKELGILIHKLGKVQGFLRCQVRFLYCGHIEVIVCVGKSDEQIHLFHLVCVCLGAVWWQ